MMKLRPSIRDQSNIPTMAAKTANSDNNGSDYYRIPTVIKTSEARHMTIRLSQSRLEMLRDSLTSKDKDILTSLSSCRYLMTNQIQRLHFYKSASQKAAMSATTRAMKKLRLNGLVSSFERRIGGVRAGSASYVWHLTEGGMRFVNMNGPGDTSRKRFVEPSYSFMRHTLSVAECYIRIVELCRNTDKLFLKEVEFEPECWRQYICAGKRISLNPDLFIVTHSDGFEDRWFIEVDLSTESPATIIFKCERYHSYYNTSLEQRNNAVFPITLWIVPDISRKDKLEEKIKSEFSNKPKLFRVITMDELGDIIINGCDPSTLY